jgi:hypothetical protein
VKDGARDGEGGGKEKSDGNESVDACTHCRLAERFT